MSALDVYYLWSKMACDGIGCSKYCNCTSDDMAQATSYWKVYNENMSSLWPCPDDKCLVSYLDILFPTVRKPTR